MKMDIKIKKAAKKYHPTHFAFNNEVYNIMNETLQTKSRN